MCVYNLANRFDGNQVGAYYVRRIRGQKFLVITGRRMMGSDLAPYKPHTIVEETVTEEPPETE